jgi:hypothetical protein
MDRLRDLSDLPLKVFDGLSPRAQDRLVGLCFGPPALAVIAVAAWLSPDPAGVGTHRQLGLGACVVLTMTGFPCAMCGMTTTFALMAEGSVWQALQNQPFGVVLFTGTVIAAIIGCLDLVFPAARWRKILGPLERREVPIAIGTLIGLLGGWLYKAAMIRGWFEG